MPTAPQMIEIKAPTKKAMPVFKPYSVNRVMTKNMIAAKIRQIRYSTFRNSFAP